MPRVFGKKMRPGAQPLGGLAARVTRLETMLFELNAYIVRIVNAQSGPDGPEQHDADFLASAEEFRRSLVAELRTLDVKGVRGGSST